MRGLDCCFFSVSFTPHIHFFLRCPRTQYPDVFELYARVAGCSGFVRIKCPDHLFSMQSLTGVVLTSVELIHFALDPLLSCLLFFLTISSCILLFFYHGVWWMSTFAIDSAESEWTLFGRVFLCKYISYIFEFSTCLSLVLFI